jgi:drug/metabolite transporter (DMT)-like permease
MDINIYLVVILTLIASLLSSYCQLLFKKGLNKKLNSIFDILKSLTNKYVFGGLVGYFISFILYLIALSSAQLSIVVPIFASSFIFVALLSAYSLKEKISFIRIVGIVLIFLGIVFVALTV